MCHTFLYLLTFGTEFRLLCPLASISDPDPHQIQSWWRRRCGALIGPHFFFLRQFKNKLSFNFVMLFSTKKVGQHTFFPLSFGAVFGSENRDPESGMVKNQNPG
jgi:hypothetical protein